MKSRVDIKRVYRAASKKTNGKKECGLSGFAVSIFIPSLHSGFKLF